MTCPYRIAPEHGCTQAASISGDTLLKAVQQRELSGRSVMLQKLHNRHIGMAIVESFHNNMLVMFVFPQGSRHPLLCPGMPCTTTSCKLH